MDNDINNNCIKNINKNINKIKTNIKEIKSDLNEKNNTQVISYGAEGRAVIYEDILKEKN